MGVIEVEATVVKAQPVGGGDIQATGVSRVQKIVAHPTGSHVTCITQSTKQKQGSKFLFTAHERGFACDTNSSREDPEWAPCRHVDRSHGLRGVHDARASCRFQSRGLQEVRACDVLRVPRDGRNVLVRMSRQLPVVPVLLHGNCPACLQLRLLLLRAPKQLLDHTRQTGQHDRCVHAA